MVWLVIYFAGIAIALAVMRDPWPGRIGTALVWPLGPIAFVAVVTMLLVASAILWPVLTLGSVALVGVLAWLTL